jgi:hypothetical protein
MIHTGFSNILLTTLLKPSNMAPLPRPGKNLAKKQERGKTM